MRATPLFVLAMDRPVRRAARRPRAASAIGKLPAMPVDIEVRNPAVAARGACETRPAAMTMAVSALDHAADAEAIVPAAVDVEHTDFASALAVGSMDAGVHGILIAAAVMSVSAMPLGLGRAGSRGQSKRSTRRAGCKLENPVHDTSPD
jgi:hypothetical protein